MVLKEEQPPRTADFAENEWALAPSNKWFLSKQVGDSPLKATNFPQTSGLRPTQTHDFSTNEW